MESRQTLLGIDSTALVRFILTRCMLIYMYVHACLVTCCATRYRFLWLCGLEVGVAYVAINFKPRFA